MFSDYRTEKKKRRTDLYECLSSSSSSSSALSSSSQISTDLSSSEVPPLIYRNALHIAVAYEAIDVVRLLLRHNIDPDSTGVFNQEEWCENRNNNTSTQSSHQSPSCPERIENAHLPGEVVLEESSVLSRSSSNTSTTQPTSHSAHLSPISCISKNSRASNSPQSVQVQRCSVETSPIKPPATKSNVTKVDELLNCNQKSDGKNSGKLHS